MKLMIINRKGVSAIVSTIMLIVFVISLGLIVVNWTGKLVGGSIDKSKSKIGTSLECGDVNLRLEKSDNDGSIRIKNNNKNPLIGFIARLIVDENAFVDYKNFDREIGGFGVIDVSYLGENGEDYIVEDSRGDSGAGVDYSNVDSIEIIPRIELEGSIVDCEMKKIKWEKV